LILRLLLLRLLLAFPHFLHDLLLRPNRNGGGRASRRLLLRRRLGLGRGLLFGLGIFFGRALITRRRSLRTAGSL
jgi:hypothetical protein